MSRPPFSGPTLAAASPPASSRAEPQAAGRDTRCAPAVQPVVAAGRYRPTRMERARNWLAFPFVAASFVLLWIASVIDPDELWP